MDRNMVQERVHSAVERGLPGGPPSSRKAALETDDAPLTAGASLILILLSSLGLWAAIWAVVASLASLGLP